MLSRASSLLRPPPTSARHFTVSQVRWLSVSMLPGPTSWRPVVFACPASRRISPVPRTPFWPFHAPCAGRFMSTRSKFSGAVHGLRPMGKGSAPPDPPLFDGPALTTLQASLDVADWSVARPRFAPGLSTTHGGFTTGDLGVSPDRTHTGWLPSACRLVTSSQHQPPCCHGAQSPGRTPTLPGRECPRLPGRGEFLTAVKPLEQRFR
jgi:hypothetical protein